MDAQVTIDDKEVQALLKQLQEKAKSPGSAMRQIAGIMHRAVEKNFDAQGRPSAWKPLAQATIKERQKHGHWPGRILQVTGQLVSSITRRYTATTAIVGTNKEYAAIHQFGGTVTHAGSSGHVFHRKFKRGKFKGKKLFSKESKATQGTAFTKGPYDVTIPARPFLVMTDQDLQRCAATLLKFITSGKGGG